MPDGGKAISLALTMPNGATNAQKYAEIETGLEVCAAAFGDYDRYYLNADLRNRQRILRGRRRLAAGHRLRGRDISQYELYNNINLTYYTK